MIFPESPRVVFKKNPLVQVICQLRFPPVLAIISREPAEFQDLVRSTHPLYETASALPQDIAAILAQLPIASPRLGETVHKFVTDDRVSEIDLTRDFIAVATTHYTRWEEFEPTVRVAVNALERVYRPSFYSRVGLRYRDVIRPTSLGLGDLAWRELIRDPVIGLLADQTLRCSIVSTQSQSLLRLDDGEFLLLQQQHGATAPEGGELAYAIDADFYAEGKKSNSDIFSTLGRFNREAGNFFRWAITEKLKVALEPEPLE